MKIDPDFLKLLMQMGFLATRKFRLAEAGVIFNGVAKARPESPFPQIGLACVAMGYGNAPKAIEILNDAPVKDRNAWALRQGFLGMALKLEGRGDECRTILTQLQEEGGNQAAVRMAGKLLKEL